MGCVTSPVHCPSRNCQWDVLPLPCFCCTVRPGTVSGMCYLSRALSVRELSVGCVTLSLVSAALSVRELSVGPVTSPKFLLHCPSGNCQWDLLPLPSFCHTVRPGTVSGMCCLSRALSVRELSVGCVTPPRVPATRPPSASCVISRWLCFLQHTGNLKTSPLPP